MPEHAEQSLLTVPTVDELLHSHNLAREQHYIPEDAGKMTAYRVSRMRDTVGDGQLNEWVAKVAERKFKRSDAQPVLQNAAIKKGKPIDTREIGRMCNALEKMYADHLDLYAGNTTAIVKRWESRAPGGKARPGEEAASEPSASPVGITSLESSARLAAPAMSTGARFDHLFDLARILVDTSPLSMDDKALAHALHARLHDSRAVFETFAQLQR